MSANNMKTADPILKVEELTKSFPGPGKVLCGINFALNKGDVVSVIGPSGCGKSTFLRCLNLMEKPDSGKITFDGEVVFDKREGIKTRPTQAQIRSFEKGIDHHREKMGMVFQHFNLFKNLTILKNIILAPTLRLGLSEDEAKERAMELLSKVGLKDKADSYPATLSGGQQQRIAIVRALAMNPKIMLFDEPTSALDPEMIKEVEEVIAQVAADGMTMIIVTHEMNFARNVANRLVFMDGGNIACDGGPKQLFSNPPNERMKAFLSALS